MPGAFQGMQVIWMQDTQRKARYFPSPACNQQGRSFPSCSIPTHYFISAFCQLTLRTPRKLIQRVNVSTAGLNSAHRCPQLHWQILGFCKLKQVEKILLYQIAKILYSHFIDSLMIYIRFELFQYI